jgi:hypothetical protein
LSVSVAKYADPISGAQNHAHLQITRYESSL